MWELIVESSARIDLSDIPVKRSVMPNEKKSG